jgi:hypothetical protein
MYSLYLYAYMHLPVYGVLYMLSVILVLMEDTQANKRCTVVATH